MSIWLQDIERKGNSGVNQGSLLWYKCAKNDVYQTQPRSCQYKCINTVCEILLKKHDIDQKRNFDINQGP